MKLAAPEEINTAANFMINGGRARATQHQPTLIMRLAAVKEATRR